MNCALCKAQEFISLVYRENVPVYQSVLCSSISKALAIPRATLDFVICKNCSFAFNRAFDSNIINYTDSYENNQAASIRFQEHLQSQAKYIDTILLPNSSVLEVGCGNGTFLKILAHNQKVMSAIGMDPALFNREIEDKITYERMALDRHTMYDKKFNLIVARHLIEHIVDPVEDLLKPLSKMLIDTGSIVIETPSLEWIIDNNVIWDFFYEHTWIPTKYALLKAGEIAGLYLQYIESNFENQYFLCVFTKDKNKSIELESSIDTTLMERCVNFKENEEQNRDSWFSKLSKQEKPIAVWGSGAKGVTFINLIDSDKSLIQFGIDIDPAKIGGYIPCTSHPIISWQDIKKLGIKTIVLMNPNYKQNLIHYLSLLGITDMNIIEKNI